MAATSIPFEPAPDIAAAPALGTRDAHLWLSPLDLPEERIAQLQLLLSADEIARALRFHFPEHRRRFIVSHGLLRELLGAYRREPPHEVAFTTGAYGKPAVESTDGAAPLHFNMAHSDEYALYGFARDELGVDLEAARSHRDLMGLAHRFFAPRERAMLEALPEVERNDAFYRVWVRKESYIKARGSGLSIPLDSFDVTATIDGWSVHDLQPAPDLSGAVALPGVGWRIGAWAL